MRGIVVPREAFPEIKILNAKIGILREFNIPEPVTGGLLFAMLFTAIYFTANIEIHFDLTARDGLLVYFFVAIGLNARFNMLLQGGKTLIFLLFATIVFMAIQNIIGVGSAYVMGLPPTVGLIGGTVSLMGGHGTTIAWASIFKDEYGIQRAMEIGIACATFGLVLASMMGGPIANYLIKRDNLKPDQIEKPDFGVLQDEPQIDINYLSVLYTLMIMNVAIFIGLGINELLESMGLKFPEFVTALFSGILLTNLYPKKMHVIPSMFKEVEWPSGSRSLALISDISLGIFLSMSLMSLQLWALIDIALPILIILSVQFLVAILFTVFVIFKLMGGDYEAAVISAGFGGYSLGSTPTAIANMTAVTTKFGGAHKAFMVVSLVGAFFIDLANVFYIKFSMSIL